MEEVVNPEEYSTASGAGTRGTRHHDAPLNGRHPTSDTAHVAQLEQDLTAVAATAIDAKSANDSRPGHDPTVRDTAHALFALGIMPIPLARESKDPNRKGWPTERYRPADVERLFHDGQGVGARWGYITDDNGTVLTRNMCDIDLDCMEAIRIAPLYLPPTGLMWGREGKPRSHYGYELTTLDFKAPASWSDMTPDQHEEVATSKRRQGKKLLEWRRSGHTVAPGSINVASGTPQLVRWEPDGHGTPARVAPEALADVLPVIAAASLVARYWRQGDRQDTALPLAGFLWHGGMELDAALIFMAAVCTGARDLEVDKRLDAVRDTYRKGDNGEHVTGGPTLEDHLTPVAVASLRKWLRLRSKKYVGVLAQDGLPLATDGDGERFAAMWVGEVLYCAVEDQWYIWEDHRWLADRVLEIKERAKQVVAEFRRSLGEQGVGYGQNGTATFDVCAKYAIDLGNDKHISAMLRAAQSKPELRITPEEFDADPLLFNTLDSTLELDPATGRIQPHLPDPADRIRMLAPVRYRPGATHRLFTQYLDRFFPEPERREHLQEHAGAVLTGMQKRSALQLIGDHDSGKSTTLALFSAVLGDYAGSLAAHSLEKNPHKGGDVARPDLWRVKHKRLVTVSEVAPDVRMDVALFKAVTGKDAMGVRTFYDAAGGEDVKFTFALWMSGNKPYGPPPDEQAAFDRLRVLLCEHVVPGATRNSQEEADLQDPEIVGEAVLAWMAEGFQRLWGTHHGEIPEPESSRQAKANLREDLDKFSALLSGMVIVTNDPADGIPRAALWEHAKLLMEMDGETIHKPRALRDAFEKAVAWRVGKLTHNSKRFHDSDYWPGLRWTEAALAFRKKMGLKPTEE
jgi:phage/plasmid-associated DNA primase